MQSLNKGEKKLVLGEVLADQLKVIEEYVRDVPSIKSKLVKLDKKVDRMTLDIKTIKLALKDTNKQVWDHEPRIRVLEIKSS